MSQRKMVKIATWPDPLVQERLEDMGFFFDPEYQAWVRFCSPQELHALGEWLKRHHLSHEDSPAKGCGETRRHPRLSDLLVLKDGGSPTTCALCGARNVACRRWIEGDDTDSVDYPDAARFFLCGACVQGRMQPHPRLYVPADEL